MVDVSFAGIVNCTPDSFSDGGKFLDHATAIAHASKLHEQGAAFIDVGGDASGPGSVCTGPLVEWNRIGPLLESLATRIPISVDTHHAETARKGISLGVRMVNDVSGGMDTEMFPCIAESGVYYVCMFSCWSAPHEFTPLSMEGLVDRVQAYFEQKTKALLSAGVAHSRIILDPGMGGFLGPTPALSWKVIEAVPVLAQMGYPLMLGISRKRFLKQLEGKAQEEIHESADMRSARLAVEVASRCTNGARLIFRVHDIAAHQHAFTEANLNGVRMNSLL